MISVLLTVLKVLGILVLALLGILLLLLLLVLFVPIRYRIEAERKLDKKPLYAKIKVTWLFHLLNVHFDYPEAPYVKVRLGLFTLFRSDRTKKETPEGEPEKEKKTEKASETKEKSTAETTANVGEAISKQEPESGRNSETDSEMKTERILLDENNKIEDDPKPSVKAFFQKILALLKNLRYTITQICDKIKKIVKNIKYYIELISSDKFKNAFRLCTTQAGALLRHICPQKIKGSIRIGTGDPASTGQVLAVYGMLYPFLGNQITVIPDFEQQVIEGELLIKGRITLFRLIRCACIIYFNKDLRQVIRMIKREAA